jgi:hypothetical protein
MSSNDDNEFDDVGAVVPEETVEKKKFVNMIFKCTR